MLIEASAAAATGARLGAIPMKRSFQIESISSTETAARTKEIRPKAKETIMDPPKESGEESENQRKRWREGGKERGREGEKEGGREGGKEGAGDQEKKANSKRKMKKTRNDDWENENLKTKSTPKTREKKREAGGSSGRGQGGAQWTCQSMISK